MQPDLSGEGPQKMQLHLSGYKARAAQRVKMPARAPEFTADILGDRQQAAQIAVSAEKVEMFGGMPEDMDGLIAENERLDDILGRARARRATEKARERQGQREDGSDPHPQ